MVNCVDGEHEIKRTGEFTRLVSLSKMNLYKECFKDFLIFIKKSVYAYLGLFTM